LKISGIIDNEAKISVISKIELLSLPNASREIVEFTNVAVVILLEENVIEKTIELRKKYRIKLPDAVIAATTLIYHLTLITHNIRDFKSISRLKLVDSYLFV
jgi:predicted nucleic acid-binding protein